MDVRKQEENNAVVSDYEAMRGEHPMGRLVHISTVTHAWRGVLELVTPSYYVLSSNEPVALVDSTGAMRDYMANPKAGSDGDEVKPNKKTPVTVRIPRAAVAWMISW